ncbi:MAG: SEC-C metal-binding domain-containing protein, partial [Desulfobacterales bacterium]
MMKRTGKVGRNDVCPCGSGLKYKKCCSEKEAAEADELKRQYTQQYKIRFKQPSDIERIKAAGKLALGTLDLVESKLACGIATDEINTWVHEFTVSHHAIP